MTKPIITIVEHNGQAKVCPGEFLGPTNFSAYRQACRASGCVYDKSLSASLIRIDLVPSLLVRLRSAGFDVRVSDDLAAAAADRAGQIIRDRKDADVRLKTIGQALYPFQVEDVKVLAKYQSFLLASEMGLGKTIIALMAIPDGSPVLVICPASLKRNWAKEITRWRPDAIIEILDGRGGFRWPDFSGNLFDRQNGSVAFDTKKRKKRSKESPNIPTGGDVPPILGLGSPESVDSGIPFSRISSEGLKPFHKRPIGIVNHDGPMSPAAGSGNTSLTVDNASEIGQISNGFRGSDRIGGPFPYGDINSTSLKNSSETVPADTKLPSNGPKRIPIENIVGKFFNEGFGNSAPRSGACHIHIVNYDILPDEEQLESLGPPPPGLVLIADEVHYLKGSAKVGRVRRGRQLMRAVRNARGRTFGLTGTPMPNTPMDLLRILSILDLLRDSFGTYPNFIHLMNGKQDYWGKWKFGTPRAGAIEALQRVMLRRLRKDVLPDLPPITYQDIEVDIPAAARRASDAARAAMAAAGVSLEKIIDGTQGFGESSETVFTARRLLAEAKIPSVLEIVGQYLEAEEPLIVFSAHRAPIIALGTVKGGVKVIMGQTAPEDRASAVLGFQGGDFGVIGGTIRAMGIGITLTRAAHILIVDDEWTPDWHDQAVSRACRIGQTRGILVKRLIAPNTIDQDHAAILANKRASINAIVNAAAGPGLTLDPQQLMNLGEKS